MSPQLEKDMAIWRFPTMGVPHIIHFRLGISTTIQLLGYPHASGFPSLNHGPSIDSRDLRFAAASIMAVARLALVTRLCRFSEGSNDEEAMRLSGLHRGFKLVMGGPSSSTSVGFSPTETIHKMGIWRFPINGGTP